MNELYYEHLIKKIPSAKDKLIKYGLIVLTALFLLAGLLIYPVFLIAGLVMIGVCYFVLPMTDLEYEYIYVDGDIDIDAVMGKSKRKRKKSFSVKDMELMAPVNSHRMDYYNNNAKMQVCDFSSNNPENRCFAVVVHTDAGAQKILFEPNEEIIDAMRMRAPGKVFMD